MDIKAFYLDYVRKLKEKKEFNVWKNLIIMSVSCIIVETVIIFILLYLDTDIYLKFLIDFVIVMVFVRFLICMKKKILERYRECSDVRKKILFEILKDENKDRENLENIKSEVEKFKEEINIFSYPIKIKSITGYMTLGSIILYGNFIMSTLKFYFEKKLEENLTIENLISVIIISSLITFFVVFPIIIIIDFFSTVYSFFGLRYYDYLITDLNNAITFNDDFKNLSNQTIIVE